MNLVMFGGPTAWDGAWYSRHHLTAALARRHRVVLVSEPRDLRDILNDRTGLLRAARIVRDSHGVLAYVPPGWLPDMYRSALLRRMFSGLRHRSLTRALRAQNALPAIHYVWHPHYHHAVDHLRTGALVYHCYDRYDRYAGAASDLLANETRLAQRAQLCVAASAELGEHLTRLGAREVIVLRHGVDNALFRAGETTHPALDRIPGPRLGIVASLTDAVDVALLLRVARQRPDWSLVIVGGVHFSTPEKQAAFHALASLPNVYPMGFQPRTELARWISGFDVAIACYDLTTWAPYIQPLKVYEYLACGIPVVGSDIGATRELGDLVARVTTPEEWVPTIARVLTQNCASAAARRVAFARANGWEQRAAELETALERVSAAVPLARRQ